MIRFFAPDIASSPILPEQESQHCVKVLRLKPGDPLQVVDGRGTLYHCRMLEAHQRHAVVETVATEPLPLPWAYRLNVAIAPTKHMDRMEWVTEKLTEVGVNSITPLLCDRSERREIKTERLEKIAVSAMKQSLKAVLPAIDPLTPISRYVDACTTSHRFIAYCDDETPRIDLAKAVSPMADTTILIGPEGDFTPQEVAHALSRGFKAVTLGRNRLRTETAALDAAITIHVINQLHQS